MKTAKLSLIVVAAAAVIFGLTGISFAFHSGGVAECMGCHQMHDAPGASLLVGSDQSSACLTCHGKSGMSSYHIATPDADMPAGTPPVNMTPGGDFGWIKKTYFYSSHGEAGSDYGDHHGHNIIAADFGYAVDADNATAPGGTFVSANLMCNSCHDQHGQVRLLGNFTFATTGAPIIGSGSYGTSKVPSATTAVGTYRLLRSNLSDNAHGAGKPTFANAPVTAFAPGTYNRSEFYTMTRVEYNGGMSDYCGSCHPGMHTDATKIKHPTSTPLTQGGIASNYNAYINSGNMGGTAASSYLSLVPFQENLALSSVATYTLLQSRAVNNDTKLGGPDATASVMCLSCHRAHATAFVNMTRWENETEFIVSNGAYPAVNGKNTVEEAAGFYNKDPQKFATYQRSLCNKCHAKD